MNEHLKISPHGLRLIQDFEGAPRLKARLCEGNAWELGWGCTYYPDGARVKEGDTIAPEFAPVMLAHCVEETENAVRRLLTVEVTQSQFDGLCGLVFNIGAAQFQTSTVLRETNANRIYDAAAAFGMWVFATTGGGYKQALRGLLRRRYAEACTYLGYQWSEACADEAIALQRERPTSLPGKDKVIYKTPFKDVLAVAQHYPLDASPEPAYAQVPVLLPTEPARIEAPVASLPDSPAGVPLDDIPTQLPLPDPIEDELFLDTPAATEETSVSKGSPPVSEPPSPSSQAAVPSQPDSNPANKDQPRVSAEAAPATAPPSPPAPPVPLPPKLPDPPIPVGQQTGAVDAARKSEDWSANAKAMWKSRRFWGLVLVMGGRLWMLKTGSNAVLGAVSDPLVTEMFSGFMVMLIGEIIQHWGERKATRPLR